MRFLKFFIPTLIAIFLILSDYKFSYLNSIKQAITKIVSPIYLLTNLPSQITTWINEKGTSKQTLLNKNKQLSNQLAQLKVALQTHNALLSENRKLTKLLGVSYTLSEHKFSLARVSAISQSRLKKQIVIDKGSNDGIKIGQIALGVKGVVGQITQVMPFYASILMITDPTQHIPVKNQRNGIRGISKGLASQQNKLQVNFIESELDIKVGDAFLSSAIGSKFPAGYPVGKVTRVKKNNNDTFLYIELTPTQTTEQLEFVLIGDSTKNIKTL